MKAGGSSRFDYISASESVNTDRHKMGTPRTLTYSKLMKEIAPQVVSGHSKVTVVGCGQVGMAAAFSMLTMGVCSDLALCDMRRDAAIGEKMDLLHGLAFLGRRVWVEADSDYAISKVRSRGVVVYMAFGVIFRENSRKVDEHFSLFFVKNFTETKESRFGYFS